MVSLLSYLNLKKEDAVGKILNKLIAKTFRLIMDGLILSGILLVAYINKDINLLQFILCISLQIIVSFSLRLGNTSWRFYTTDTYSRLLLSSMIAMSPMLVISISQYALYVGAFYITKIICRNIRKFTYFKTEDSNVKLENIIIVGSSQKHITLARLLDNSNYKVVGLIDSCDIYLNKGGYKVIGSVGDLEKIDNEYNIDAIVLDEDVDARSVTLLVEVSIARNIRVLKNSYTGKTKNLELKPFSLGELLDRNDIKVDLSDLENIVRNQVVLITGAGGSIGSEIVRQISKTNVSKIIILDNSEYNLFSIKNELDAQNISSCEVIPVMIDIKDYKAVENLFVKYEPDFVFHAAAYKHVHMVELNPHSAILNNVLGTRNLITLSNEYHVNSFLLVSTDKAVNPTSVMGATKRLCEILVTRESLRSETKFVSVRFGNVLGSSGSLIPILKEQISKGGPLTITDERMKRFFMSIPEAVGLVLKSMTISESGSVSILKMGEPVKIVDIAKRLIYLAGYKEEDIEITFTGMKPGEKLYEELYLCGNEISTKHPDIVTLLDGDCGSLLCDQERINEFETTIQNIINLALDSDQEALTLVSDVINRSNRLIDSTNSFNVELSVGA